MSKFVKGDKKVVKFFEVSVTSLLEIEESKLQLFTEDWLEGTLLLNLVDGTKIELDNIEFLRVNIEDLYD